MSRFDIKTKPSPLNLFSKVTVLENGGGAKTIDSSISKLISNENPLEKAARKGYITDLFIEHLVPFSEHPFKMYPQEKLEEMADSIKQYGVIFPIIVRKIGDSGKYEILAGHNRTAASKLAGLIEIPARVIEVDDNEARIIVAESNLKQREKLLPSEKAFAYKMQLEAIKNREKSLSQNGQLSSCDEDFEDLCPLDTRQNSGDEVAEKVNESRKNIYRFIRLTFLSKDLMDMVDEETIPFRAAVEISYLREREQLLLYRILSSGEQYKLDIEKASFMRDRSKAGKLDIDSMTEILSGNFLKPKNKSKAIKDKSPYTKVFKNIQKYLEKIPDAQVNSNDKELEQVIIQAIDNYLKTKSCVGQEE